MGGLGTGAVERWGGPPPRVLSCPSDQAVLAQPHGQTCPVVQRMRRTTEVTQAASTLQPAEHVWAARSDVAAGRAFWLGAGVLTVSGVGPTPINDIHNVRGRDI